MSAACIHGFRAHGGVVFTLKRTLPCSSFNKAVFWLKVEQKQQLLPLSSRKRWSNWNLMRPQSPMKSLAADPLLNSVFEGEVLRRLSGGKRCLWNDIDVWRAESPNGVEFLNAALQARLQQAGADSNRRLWAGEATQLHVHYYCIKRGFTVKTINRSVSVSFSS